MIKLIAFDLDGTLTQHKTPLEPANYEALLALSKKYKLLMAGAGACMRIFNQLGGFPIDIIGNYGLQFGQYNPDTKTLDIVENNILPCDRESVESRVTMCREKYGFTEYAGDNVQYHESGCVTFPIIGTEAKIEDKLAFDPDRSKRRAIYGEICEIFSDYNVFVGGSSSFDMAPRPFNKYYALKKYCENNGIALDEVAFVGDDYGPGGNDESVYLSEIRFVKVDDYRTFPEVMKAEGLL
ncbi:MAG: HAD family phosphatase [Clostridia bacterium]|nr:HAD family phosphatase [Clostridia bacterium]MBR6744328.1 HAD family phosphatase [Clostridia bacterium]